MLNKGIKGGLSILSHPLPKGTKVRTLVGEQDEDEDGTVRHAPPGSVGEVICADYHPNGERPQGWTYGIEFPGGCWVFIDQSDSIDDPTKYQVVEE
jgi:hypothetical protein